MLIGYNTQQTIPKELAIAKKPFGSGAAGTSLFDLMLRIQFRPVQRN